MPALAIRKATFDGLSVRDRTILKLVRKGLALGEPALYQTGGGVVWYVFDDARFTLRQLAYFGTVVVGIATNTTYEIPLHQDGSIDRDRLEADIRAWAASRVVLPEAIAYTQGGNPWQETLDAQGTPSAVRAAASVPADLTPVAP